MGVLDDAAEAAKDTAGKAKEAAGNAAEDVSEGVGDAADRAASGAKDTADRAASGAKDTADRAASGAKDTADRAASGASDAADRAASGASDAADRAGRAAKDVSDDVSDTADTVSSDVSDATVEVSRGVSDTADRAASEASDATANVSRATVDTADKAASDATETIDQAASGASNIATRIGGDSPDYESSRTSAASSSSSDDRTARDTRSRENEARETIDQLVDEEFGRGTSDELDTIEAQQKRQESNRLERRSDRSVNEIVLAQNVGTAAEGIGNSPAGPVLGNLEDRRREVSSDVSDRLGSASDRYRSTVADPLDDIQSVGSNASPAFDDAEGSLSGDVARSVDVFAAGESAVDLSDAAFRETASYAEGPEAVRETQDDIAGVVENTDEIAEGAVDAFNENPERFSRAGAGAVLTGVGGIGASRGITRGPTAARSIYNRRSADEVIDFDEITAPEVRTGRGELPQFETPTSAPTSEAVGEVRRRAADQPDAVTDAMDGRPTLYRSDDTPIDTDLEVGEGNSELPMLFNSPDLSPLRIRDIDVDDASSSGIGLPRPRVDRDQVTAFPGDDIRGMPDTAAGSGRIPDPEGEGYVPDPDTPGYQFLTEDAEEGVSYVRPTGDRTTELESGFPVGSEFVERADVNLAVETPEGRAIPFRAFDRPGGDFPTRGSSRRSPFGPDRGTVPQSEPPSGSRASPFSSGGEDDAFPFGSRPRDLESPDADDLGVDDFDASAISADDLPSSRVSRRPDTTGEEITGGGLFGSASASSRILGDSRSVSASGSASGLGSAAGLGSLSSTPSASRPSNPGSAPSSAPTSGGSSPPSSGLSSGSIGSSPPTSGGGGFAAGFGSSSYDTAPPPTNTSSGSAASSPADGSSATRREDEEEVELEDEENVLLDETDRDFASGLLSGEQATETFIQGDRELWSGLDEEFDTQL